jgi:hypothetical protein
MPAASTTNRPGAFDRIHDLIVRDSLSLAQRCLNDPTIDEFVQQALSHPDHPRQWHRRAVDAALAQPRSRDIYFRMRQSLWTWPEFSALLPNARRILDAVVELARDEAFPWFVNVQADEILRLVCIDRKTFFDRLHDLECFTITRPARRIKLLEFDERATAIDRAEQIARWPTRENKWLVDESTPAQNITQWVIRYRRGIPHNKRRAAWWINYDLLCRTQRVLPCFEVCLDTLPKNYFDRNRRSGSSADLETRDGFKVLERRLAKDGPPPPPGLRAALWDGE